MLACGRRASADDSFAMAKQASEEAAFAHSYLVPSERELGTGQTTASRERWHERSVYRDV
jgi:hypothetical protein